MKVWCSLDGDGRPEQVFLSDIGSPDLTETEMPDGVVPEQLADYVWDGSAWVYDGAATAAREEAEAEEEALRQRRMAVPMLLSAVAESMDDDELASVALALPEWGPGVKRKRGAACRHGGVAYRVVANVSKNNDAEPGTPEGADYYAPVDVGPSGVQAWEPDKPYMKGERVEHGGRVWESLKNNNREEPGTGNRWAREGDATDWS